MEDIVIFIIALIIVSPFGYWLLLNARKAKQEREAFDQTFKIACKEFLEEREYLKPLVRKRKQLIVKDDYGDYIFKLWDKAVDDFIANKMQNFVNCYLFPSFGTKRLYGRSYVILHEVEFLLFMRQMIQSVIYEAQSEAPQETVELETITDPIEYEHAICEVFTNCGWNAQVTKASGDQGVDVIAELNGVRVAVQCKLYSSPVGNKAVQEVFAAKTHYDCQLAIVVTNNSYTPSAKQLASTCGVELLHHDELTNWIADQA